MSLTDYFIYQDNLSIHNHLTIDVFCEAHHYPTIEEASYAAGAGIGIIETGNIHIVMAVGAGVVPHSTGAVLAHEIGHCLGLSHTFPTAIADLTYDPELFVFDSPGWLSCYEVYSSPWLVDQNCNWLLADEPFIFSELGLNDPSDPLPESATECQEALYNLWIQSFAEIVDGPDDVQYAPPIDNIMSYTYPPCRNSSTPGQAEIMWSHILTNPSAMGNTFLSTDTEFSYIDIVVSENETLEYDSGTLLHIN